jgi:hypothetical protein
LIYWSSSRCSQSFLPLLGIYKHFYDTNWNDAPGYGTHYACLAYELRLPTRIGAVTDTQHSELIWASLPDVARPEVHPYALAYPTGELVNPAVSML